MQICKYAEIKLTAINNGQLRQNVSIFSVKTGTGEWLSLSLVANLKIEEIKKSLALI